LQEKWINKKGKQNMKHFLIFLATFLVSLGTFSILSSWHIAAQIGIWCAACIVYGIWGHHSTRE